VCIHVVRLVDPSGEKTFGRITTTLLPSALSIYTRLWSLVRISDSLQAEKERKKRLNFHHGTRDPI
jgi:hypothetical protein